MKTIRRRKTNHDIMVRRKIITQVCVGMLSNPKSSKHGSGIFDRIYQYIFNSQHGVSTTWPRPAQLVDYAEKVADEILTRNKTTRNKTTKNRSKN